MKHSLKFKVSLLLFILAFTGCVTSHKPKTPRMTHPEIPHQAPSVVTKHPSSSKVCDSKMTEKVIEEFALIESSFLAQNCDLVLEHVRVLQSIYPNNDFGKQPPVIQAAVYTCDAKAGLNDMNRLKLAISHLKTVSLRYPFINEAWVHNTLADFYVALNDIPNALLEKKQSRDLLLAQQQDISSLNVDILKLNPSETSTLSQSPAAPLQNSPPNQSIDQIVTSATQLINNDSPDQAIALLDTIQPAQRTESIKRLRAEAINNLVTNLRFKVRALFVRSTEQTGKVKKESLQQCEQILKGIIQNYPDYQDMPAILNNLKQVQREINK